MKIKLIFEAAGYGASIAIKEGILPKNVDVNKIRAKINANGGILAFEN